MADNSLLQPYGTQIREAAAVENILLDIVAMFLQLSKYANRSGQEEHRTTCKIR
jgi:hypothetical protein